MTDELSFTRQNFRSALAEVEDYLPPTPAYYPAFMFPLAELPAIQRQPLPDLPAKSTANSAHENGQTLADAGRSLAQGSITIQALARQSLDAIAARNAELNAFVYVAPESEIMAQAQALEAEAQAGKRRSPLHGIPVSVKDVIAVQGMPNTASSRVLAECIAPEDAIAVKRLREAGAIILGKTHTHEFALGVTTPQSRNPRDSMRDPGGSSGGSAIAVTTGMGLGSLGTDTRASIRVPAALCGVVGYKPSYGLVPTQGVTTLSWSLDHVAPMARTVEDIAWLLNPLTKAAERGEDYTSYLNKDVRGLRVGLAINALKDADPGVLTAFQNSVAALQALGVEVVETDVPSDQEFNWAVSMGLILSRCEAAAYHRAFEDQAALYTRPVREQLEEANQVTAVTYLQAQRYRAAFQQRMLEHLKEYDALLMPTSRVPAPKTTEVENFFLTLSLNCIPWSFIGFPAISLPCGLTPDQLPVGAQLVAGPFEDGRLLALAAALEAKLKDVQ